MAVGVTRIVGRILPLFFHKVGGSMRNISKKFRRSRRSLELEGRSESVELSGAYSPCFFQKVGGSMRNLFDKDLRNSVGAEEA